MWMSASCDEWATLPSFAVSPFVVSAVSSSGTESKWLAMLFLLRPTMMSVADAGGHRLFDDVLDRRLVDDGQHLFGHRLGGGKEPRAEARSGDDGLVAKGHAISCRA
jgi:hypothetical protein